MEIKKNVSLKNYSTFKIGGKAKYFSVVKTTEEILKAISFAKERKVPFFVLGGGSNVLFSDNGFEGLVIKLQNTQYEIQNTKIITEAGVPLQKLVLETTKRGLSGLENLAGIPGTLGGAIWGNAGAFGREIGDLVEKVKILEVGSSRLKIKELKKKDCKFGYRNSVFKKKKNWIVLEATLKLKKSDKREIEEKIKEILKLRKEKQPLEFPCAGSVFKNIPVKDLPKKIKEKFKDKIKNGFLSAGFLIEIAGLKGYQIGKAKISQKHANFIVNLGNAKSKEIVELIKLVKGKVKRKFGVELKEEIQVIIPPPKSSSPL
jgi:UDP-N-acetylmuramate dehydrogenase